MPNINLEGNKSINLVNILNGKQLFIKVINLTNIYTIRYIRPINHKRQKIKKKKIFNRIFIKDFR